MRTDILRTRKGITIIETVISVGLLTLVLACTIAILTTMLGLWSKGASGTSANSYASLAMRKLVQQIEEGQSASVVNDQLVVTFPYYDSVADRYQRTSPGDTVTFYISGETGGESTGTYLWKSKGIAKTRLARNVMKDDSLPLFTVTNGNLVHINFKGWDQEGGCISPNLVQQSVKLRNS